MGKRWPVCRRCDWDAYPAPNAHPFMWHCSNMNCPNWIHRGLDPIRKGPETAPTAVDHEARKHRKPKPETMRVRVGKWLQRVGMRVAEPGEPVV